MLNRVLMIETCQELIFRAAHITPHFLADPVDDVLRVRDLASIYGSEVYIPHPTVTEQMFHGVTLTVYQETQRLFCSRTFRSYQMVSRILDTLALEAGASLVAREAVWAMCGYLRDHRDEQFAPSFGRSQSEWYIGQVWPDVVVMDRGEAERPELLCIIDQQNGRMIASRRRRHNEALGEGFAATLYDGLSAQRRPAALTPGGLEWFLPSSLVSQTPLSQEVITCCQELEVAVSRTSDCPALVDDLQGVWTRSLAGRSISSERFALILDNYLEKRHHYGPLIAAERAEHTFRHLEGYNRDPALVLPPLRWLLPAYTVTIDADATLTAGGRRYHDDLLRYWIGSPVMVRVSRHNPDFAYIYLDGEILCVASQVA
jgi:hypothetical protein